MKNQPSLETTNAGLGMAFNSLFYDNKANQTVNLPTDFNLKGEARLIDAPQVNIAYHQTTPQQFFHYERSRENVEYILSQIDFDENFPLFVHEEHDCLFLQVGIIGHENYPKDKETKVRPKIVYGRRWYIEPYTPTSEVIQTAFLALIKAREHELREYFHFYIDEADKTYRTTPFNTHMDLPLMAKYPKSFSQTNTQTVPLDELNTKELEQIVSDKLTRLCLGKLNCKLTNLLTLPVTNSSDTQKAASYLLSISITGEADSCQAMAKYFPEQVDKTHHLIIEHQQAHNNNIDQFINCIYHELFNAMLKACSEHVSRQFTFAGFARFDHQLSIEKIAKFSAQTRLVSNDKKSECFQQAFKLMVATVDSEKAPLFAHNSDLYHKQTKVMDRYETMDGYLPRHHL